MINVGAPLTVRNIPQTNAVQSYFIIIYITSNSRLTICICKIVFLVFIGTIELFILEMSSENFRTPEVERVQNTLI